VSPTSPLAVALFGRGFWLFFWLRHLRLRQSGYSFIERQRMKRYWRTLLARWIRIVFLPRHSCILAPESRPLLLFTTFVHFSPLYYVLYHLTPVIVCYYEIEPWRAKG
jgi:hypothetical protein